MENNTILASVQLELVEEFVTVDAKKRVRIASLVPTQAYNIYRNSKGQILLDPVRTVSMWQLEQKNKGGSTRE